MANATPASTRKREHFYFKVADKQYVKLALIKSSFTPTLLTTMGAEDALPADSAVVASDKENALSRGVFYLNIYYPGASGKSQAAKIPIAPDKADTAFQALRGKKYRGKVIDNVRVPRRRCYKV